MGQTGNAAEVVPLGPSVLRLEIRGVNGGITLKPVRLGEEPRIEVRKTVAGFLEGVMARYLSEVEIRSVVREDSLSLEVLQPAKRPFGVTGSTVSFVIHVPELQLERFLGTVRNGNVNIEGFRGVLDLQTSNGSVTLRDVSGVARVLTSNGAIVFNRCEFLASSRFITSNAPITGDLRLAYGYDYLFETTNAGVELSFPRQTEGFFDLITTKGTASIRLSDQRVQGTTVAIQIGQAATNIRIRTTNGSIMVQEEFRL